MEFEKAYNLFLSEIRIKKEINVDKNGFVDVDGYNTPVQKILNDLGVKLNSIGEYENGSFKVKLLHEGNICVYEYNKLMPVYNNGHDTIFARDDNNESFLISYITRLTPDKNLLKDPNFKIENETFFAIKSGAFKETSPETIKELNLKLSENTLFLEDANYNILHLGNKDSTLESIKNDLKNVYNFISRKDLENYCQSNYIKDFMTEENADFLTDEIIQNSYKKENAIFIKHFIYKKSIEEAFKEHDVKKLERIIDKSKDFFEKTIQIYAESFEDFNEEYFEDFKKLYNFCNEKYEEALYTNKEFADSIRRTIGKFNNYFYNLLTKTYSLIKANKNEKLYFFLHDEIKSAIKKQTKRDITKTLEGIDAGKVVSFDKAFNILINETENLSDDEIHKLTAYVSLNKPKDFNKEDYYSRYNDEYGMYLKKELFKPMTYQEMMSFYEVFPCEEFCKFIAGSVFNEFLQKDGNEDRIDEVIKKIVIPTFYSYIKEENPTLCVSLLNGKIYSNNSKNILAEFNEIKNEKAQEKLEIIESKILKSLYKDGFFNNFSQGLLIKNYTTDVSIKISSNAFPGSHSHLSKYDEKEKIKFNQYVKTFDDGNKLYFTKAKDGRYHKNIEIFPCNKSNIAKELAAKFEYSKTKTPEFETILSSFDGSEVVKDTFVKEKQEIIPKITEEKEVENSVQITNHNISSYIEKIKEIEKDVFDEEIKKDLNNIKGSLESYDLLNVESKKMESFLEIYFAPILDTIVMQSNLYKNKNINMDNDVLKENRKLLKDTLKTVSNNLSQKVEDEIIYNTMISNSHLSTINEILSTKNDIDINR